MAGRLLLLALVLLMLPCIAGGAEEWTELTSVNVSVDNPAHVDNFTFKLVDYSYGDSSSNAWVIMETQYRNITVENEPIQLPQSIVSFVYSDEPYEYNFSVGSFEYSTEDADVKLTGVEVLFRGNPPKPELTFNVSTLLKRVESVSSIHAEKLVRTTGYVNERFPIELNIMNNLSIPLKLNVSDTVPEGFVLDPYTEMSWEVLLQPHGAANLSYTVQALSPGRYNLSRPAIVGEQSITISWGDNASTVVLGPDVDATKKASREGDVVSVELSLTNTGIEEVDIWLVDFLPEGGTLIDGTPNTTTHLKVGESFSNSYNFSASGDKVVLPPAQVLFVSHHRVDKFFKEDLLLPSYFRSHADPRYAYGLSESNIVVLERSSPAQQTPASTSNTTNQTTATPPEDRAEESSEEGPLGIPAYDGILLLVVFLVLANLRKYL